MICANHPNIANAEVDVNVEIITLVAFLGDEVPQSVRDKAKAVADAGGMTALKKLMDELPELLTRNTEILDECERMLKEERESDEQLKAQHKEKWNRTPSGQLTGTFNTNATKYRTIINNAKAVSACIITYWSNMLRSAQHIAIISCFLVATTTQYPPLGMNTGNINP